MSLPYLIDLTHTLEAGMPVYPGSEEPEVSRTAKIIKDGFRETRINMLNHTGTHVDCPAHLLEKGLSVDKLPVDRFYGPAFIIDCRMGKSGKVIRKAFLLQYEQKLRQADFALFCTGWSQLWGIPQYFENYPVLDETAAAYLAGFTLKGVGFDTPSADQVDTIELPNHKILLDANLILIENLANLVLLIDKSFIFSCLPLKIKDGDGSPVRAVAMVEE